MNTGCARISPVRTFFVRTEAWKARTPVCLKGRIWPDSVKFKSKEQDTL